MISTIMAAVEILILVGVWIGVYLEWKSLQEKQRTRIRRQVTNLLKSLRGSNHAVR